MSSGDFLFIVRCFHSQGVLRELQESLCLLLCGGSFAGPRWLLLIYAQTQIPFQSLELSLCAVCHPIMTEDSTEYLNYLDYKDGRLKQIEILKSSLIYNSFLLLFSFSKVNSVTCETPNSQNYEGAT